ncbi:uncharacterized protein METZ01_LOCUS78827, partial [marine metagenome]
RERAGRYPSRSTGTSLRRVRSMCRCRTSTPTTCGSTSTRPRHNSPSSRRRASYAQRESTCNRWAKQS